MTIAGGVMEPVTVSRVHLGGPSDVPAVSL